MAEPNCEIIVEQGSRWFWVLFDRQVRFFKAKRDGNYWRFPDLDRMSFPGPGTAILNALFDTREEAFDEAIQRANERIADTEEALSHQRAELERLLSECQNH